MMGRETSCIQSERRSVCPHGWISPHSVSGEGSAMDELTADSSISFASPIPPMAANESCTPAWSIRNGLFHKSIRAASPMADRRS